MTCTCIGSYAAHLLESFWDVMDASEMHTGPAAPRALIDTGCKTSSDRKKIAKNFTVILQVGNEVENGRACGVMTPVHNEAVHAGRLAAYPAASEPMKSLIEIKMGIIRLCCAPGQQLQQQRCHAFLW